MPENPKQKKAWDEWLAATGKEFDKRFKFYFRRAHGKIGQVFVKLARDKIASGDDYAKNAPLTTALKGSSRPLVDGGGSAGLLGSITYKVTDHTKVRVGVGPSPRVGKGGRMLYEILHNGARIKVTKKMVWYMMMRLKEMGLEGKFKGRTKDARRQHQAAIEGASKALANSKKGTGYWIIPARPFIDDPVTSPIFQAEVEAIYAEALELVLKEPIHSFKAKAAAERAQKVPMRGPTTQRRKKPKGGKGAGRGRGWRRGQRGKPRKK